MITVYLHGALGARFGARFDLIVRSPAEAIRALCAQLEGFEAALRAGGWAVFRGPLEGRRGLAQARDVQIGFREDERELHLLPELRGAMEGAGKILAGVLLVAASFALPGSTTILGAQVALQGSALKLGAALALGGVAQALAPKPQTPQEAERPSSELFSQISNTAQPGAPVPVVFGSCEVGSVVVSVGIATEDRRVSADD